MIRGLVLFLGLWLGLCLAVLFGGSIGHLRQVSDWTGRALPDWTEGIEEGSGFTRGTARIDGARLTWAMSGWSGFDLTLSGADWRAEGFARPSGAVLEVSDLSGIVSLDWLGAGAGAMALQGGALSVGLDGTMRAAQVEGQARGGAVEGPARLTWDNGWALTATP